MHAPRMEGTAARWVEQARRVARDRDHPRTGVRAHVRDARQEPPGVGHLRAGQHEAARAVLHRPAGVHHQDVVGHLGDDAEVVGDDHDRRVELTLQVLEQVEDLRLDGDVESGGRLVGDEERRVVDQTHRDHRALPHAARELVRVLVDPAVRLRDADAVEHLDRPPAGVALGRAGVVDQVGLRELLPDLVDTGAARRVRPGRSWRPSCRAGAAVAPRTTRRSRCRRPGSTR